MSATSLWVIIGVPLATVLLLLAGLWWLHSRNNAPRKPRPATVPTTRFSDVAGADDAVAEIAEIVDMLTNPDAYTMSGARRPRGVLLTGPPGVGKTLLARAVAGQAGVPFYAVSGASFVERYVGVGASRVRTLFTQARKHSKGAIIFIDEIDAIARQRGEGTDTTTEHESTLNELLVALDGFNNTDNVVVLAATNLPENIDPALRRPGRLERTIHVGLPDLAGRVDILNSHIAARNISTEADLSTVAARLPGATGAELERIVNEAALEAARERQREVSSEHFSAAVETVTLGRERSSLIVTERDRTITAWHEAGHTVAALVLPDAGNPTTVSIIPRGSAGGATWTEYDEALYTTMSQAKARLIVAMAGRAGEEILLDGDHTTGPHSDLRSATTLAYTLVTSHGISGDLLATRNGSQDHVLAADPAVAGAVQALLAEALNEARTLLYDNARLLGALAGTLLSRDTLTRAELEELTTNLTL